MQAYIDWVDEQLVIEQGNRDSLAAIVAEKQALLEDVTKRINVYNFAREKALEMLNP